MSLLGTKSFRAQLAGLALALAILFVIFLSSMRWARPEASLGVLAWWAFLCAVSLVNWRVWSLSKAEFARKVAKQPPLASRRGHLILSAIFVGVCGFRSFFPRADVQRICFFDIWLCSVFVGRTVATVAEMSFVAQWALLLREAGTEASAPIARGISRVILPFIAIAETCSWYAVITTSYIGNALEQSIWTFTAGLATVGLVSLRRHLPPRHRWSYDALILFGVAFVCFMCTVDVPMYVSRWRLDTAQGRAYFGLWDGLQDLWQRRVVTYRWEDWREELAWMAGYFSAAVWGSILLLHLPRVERAAFKRSA